MNWVKSSLASLLPRSELPIFLLLGSLAALVNWVVRFPLSLFLSYECAVMGAYLIGMTCGYLLYGRYVFRNGNAPILVQICKFMLVNAVGIVMVVVVASVLANFMAPFVTSDRGLAEAVSHGLAIGTSALTSFVGHKRFTFAQRG